MPGQSEPYFGDGMPVPELSDDTTPFWDACNRHRLLVQRCGRCGTHRFPPRPVCWNCQSLDSEWSESSGEGSVFSYTIAYHTAHAVAFEEVPYNIAIIELADCGGALVISNVVDCPPDRLRVGMPVHLAWEDRPDGQSLYRFRALG
jgi:uncharacterized OB-fold protein